MFNVDFSQFGLTSAVEVLRTFQVSGKAKEGGFATAEITIARLVFDPEGQKAGPIVSAMRVLKTPGNSAPMLGVEYGRQWEWRMSGYSRDEESALHNALINFEMWYLDTTRAREAEAVRNKQTPK